MNAPALKIYRCAMQYAKSKGMKFFTIKEQRKALRQYLLFQSQKN